MNQSISTGNFDIEKLRTKLSKMTDPELRTFKEEYQKPLVRGIELLKAQISKLKRNR